LPLLSPDDEQFALGKLEHLLLFRFRRLRELISERYRESNGDTGKLKAGDLTILALIEANPSISQTDIARIGGVDQAVLVGVLDDLEERGLALRVRDQTDRRRHKLEITPKGKRVVADLFRRAFENEASARAVLTAEENAALDSALRKLHQHVS